jgi:hypothetical protein
MTQTKSAPASTAASSGSEIATNFAAIALAAVSWDGVLTMAGSRALRPSAATAISAWWL